MPEPESLSILLIGGLPPPVGGVSIHLLRLRRRLAKSGHRCRIRDDARVPPWLLPAWLAWLLLAQRARRRPLVHVHSGNWRTRCLTVLLGRLLNLPVLLTLHSFRAAGRGRTNLLARIALRHATIVVAVNAEIAAACIALGAASGRVRVQHAYLDPGEECGTLPPAILDFIADHRPCLAAGAFRLRFHDGVDLYGLDMLVELLRDLRAHRPQAGLVFVLPETGLPGHLATCRRTLNELDLAPHFLIVEEAVDFVALLKRADLLVRPTTSDGDSLSLREALYVGCRALASDAAPRPSQVRLFRSRDGQDLLRGVLRTLDQPPPPPDREQDGLAGVLAAYGDARRG
jgi:glycosyltransferase involved in cell wall biosynthesis